MDAKSVIVPAVALVAGFAGGYLLESSMPVKIMVYDTADLATYVGTLSAAKPGDPKYCSLFDINKDGVIDTKDTAYFSANVNTVIELTL
jgi:hypothetical protein